MSTTLNPLRLPAFTTGNAAGWPYAVPSGGVTVLCGPAGCGKTTLLRQWAREFRANGLDVVAVSGHLSSTAEGIGGLEKRGRQPDALLIDDSDRLERAALVRVLERWGRRDGSRLVIASRSQPIDLDLERLSGGRMTVLDHRNFVLSEATVRSLIEARAVGVRPEHLDVIVGHVQGWAMGAQLAGRVLSVAPDIDRAVDRFSGKHPLVSQYLHAEIFGSLSPEDEAFLVSSSVLTELTPAACELVTGEHFSGARLARLGSRYAGIVEGDRCWRWLPFVREALTARLDVRPPQETTELRRRARGWAASRRSYDSAIAQGIAAGDWDAVVAIILDEGLALAATGGAAKVLKWIDSLPRSVLSREAGVAVVAAYAVWADQGDDATAAINDWLSYGSSVARGRPPAGCSSIDAALAVVRAVFGGGGPRQSVRLAASVRDDVAGNGTWNMVVSWGLGLASYLDDDPGSARDALRACLVDGGERGLAGTSGDLRTPRMVVAALGVLALIELDDGNVAQADAMLSVIAVAERDPDLVPNSFRGGIIALATARRALVERSDDEVALKELTRLGDESLHHSVRVLANLDLAVAYGRLEDPELQAVHLAKADRLLSRMDAPGRLLARRRNEATALVGTGDRPGVAATLTQRELEVLRLLASDLSRREIAKELFLAHNTIKTYVQRIYRKLGVSSRPAAIARARERGWIT